MPREEGDLTLRMTKFPIYDAEGEFRAIGSIGVDITDLKHAEIALRESLAQVEELKNRLHEENVYLKEEIKLNHNFEEIQGRSDKLKKVLQRVERVTTTDATVLVLGETGTGKELVARAIHNLSPRRARCAALPESLVESELFSAVLVEGAYLSVPYRGFWFYVNDSDLATKRTLGLLTSLIRLTISAGGAQNVPILTLPVTR